MNAMRKRLIPGFLSLALLLSACAGTEGEKQTAEVVGGIFGFVIGHLVGSTIGSGSGQQVAQGVGAIVGVFVGRQLARDLTDGDNELFGETVDDSLENDDTGDTSTWENPDSGNAGSVTPTSDPYETVSNTQCRDFESTIVVEGEVETANGRACRQDDGSWKIVQ